MHILSVSYVMVNLTFKALRNDRVVAEAENLEELAKKLEVSNVEPTRSKDLSSKKLTQIVRTGLRG